MKMSLRYNWNFRCGNDRMMHICVMCLNFDIKMHATYRFWFSIRRIHVENNCIVWFFCRLVLSKTNCHCKKRRLSNLIFIPNCNIAVIFHNAFLSKHTRLFFYKMFLDGHLVGGYVCCEKPCYGRADCIGIVHVRALRCYNNRVRIFLQQHIRIRLKNIDSTY